MPVTKTLIEHSVSVVRGRELDPEQGAVRTWTLLFTDQRSGDVTSFGFREEVRDFIVKGLTSGIVVAADMPTGDQTS